MRVWECLARDDDAPDVAARRRGWGVVVALAALVVLGLAALVAAVLD